MSVSVSLKRCAHEAVACLAQQGRPFPSNGFRGIVGTSRASLSELAKTEWAAEAVGHSADNRLE